MMKRVAQRQPSAAIDVTPVKCLACGHDNHAGEAFCEACGSSVDLQLCKSCEAINAGKAQFCHACGVPLSGPLSSKALPVIVPGAVYRPSRTRSLVLLLLLPLGIALFVVYYFHSDSFAGLRDIATASLPGPEKAPPSAPRAAGPQPLAAPAPAVAEAPASDAAKRAPAAVRPADARQSARSNRPASAVVTHTATAARPAVVGMPDRKDAAPNGIAPKAMAPSDAPTKNAAPEPPPTDSADSAPKALQPAHPRVTHTRPMSAGAATVAASNSQASRGARNSPGARSSSCGEAVAALGLCSSN